jgi:EAL domain-containing protein (putative c-di-GMP-specific phosphodiesterase class I)
MGGSASTDDDVDGDEDDAPYTDVEDDAPWVLVVAARDAARDWLVDKIEEHVEVRAAASGRAALEIAQGRVRPSLLVIDLDELGDAPTQLLWELTRACPNAPRLLLATPGTRAHVDGRAFAELGDLLLDQPCSFAQIEVALAHQLAAVLLDRPAPRGAIEIPAQVASRVDLGWRAGRTSSCWCIDLTHARRALAASWNDGVAEIVASVVARTLAEVFPGLVEVLRMQPIEPASLALVVAHGTPRAPLDTYASRVEQAIDAALAPLVAGLGDGKLRVAVTASDVRPVTRAQVAPRLAAAIAAARAGSADRLRDALAIDRGRLTAALDRGLNFAFQPIIDLGAAELFAYQAQVQPTWDKALGSASDVAYLAGAVGLRGRYDEEAVRGALHLAMDLGPRPRMFVRISPHWPRDLRGVQAALKWTRAAHLVPAQIVFELDELTELRGAVSPRELLAPLVEAGFGVALACRGGGHVTLDDLTAVSPDFLMLPASWVRGLGRSRVRRELVAALVRLARALDVVVVAAGADTVEDLAALCELGVRYAKGVVFGRPWATFACPRPRGLAQLASIQCGEVVVPPIIDDGDRFDDATGEVSTALRRVANATLREDSQVSTILRDMAAIAVPEALPLRELVAEIDACFAPA